jgi:hypothetical protein
MREFDADKDNAALSRDSDAMAGEPPSRADVEDSQDPR